MKKRVIALALATISALCLMATPMAAATPTATPVLITEPTDAVADISVDQPATMLPEKLPQFAIYDGVVESVEAGIQGYRVEISFDNNGAKDRLILLVYEDTAIVDNEKQQVISVTKLAKGDKIRAWTSQMMMMSYPGQVNTYAIVAGADKGQAMAQYYIIGQVEKTDKHTVITDNMGDIILTLTKDTKVVYEDNDRDDQEMIPGAGCFAWMQMIMESYPAQANPDALLVMEAEHDDYIQVLGIDIYVNGIKISKPAIREDGVTYLPLFTTAKPLEYSTRWNSSLKQARLMDDGEQALVVKADSDEYTITDDGVDTGFYMMGKSFIKNGQLYVDSSLFEKLDCFVYVQSAML